MGYSDQATEPAAVRNRAEHHGGLLNARTDARTYDFRRPSRLAREDAHLLKTCSPRACGHSAR